MSIKGRLNQQTSFSEKHLRIFLMRYLGWLEATFE